MSNTSNNPYGIPSNTIKKIEKVENGTYYQINGYDLYIPDDVNANTAAFIYYPGSGGYNPDANPINEFIHGGSPNQIIVIPHSSSADRSLNGTGHLKLIENIGEENGVEIRNISSMGFSAGGPAVYNTLVSTVSAYPDDGPRAIVMCDVVSPTVREEHLELLAKNESIVLCMEPKGSVLPYQKKLAQAGADVVMVWTSSGHSAHVQMNKEALYNGMINFVSGETDTLENAEIYTFAVYDKNTGKWKEISLDEVAEKLSNCVTNVDDPFRYYKKLSKLGELKSSNAFIQSSVNGMRNTIKNSNFLSASVGSTYSSTTQMPTAETEVVQSFFTACAHLLNTLEKDTKMIVEIGELFKSTDSELANQANKLNDSTNQTYGNNTNNSTNQTYSNTSNNSSNTSSNNSSNNSWTNGGNYYSGNSSNNNSSSNTGGSSNNNGSSGNESTVTPPETSTEVDYTEQINEIRETFLDYNELYTGDNIKVYQADNYKVVVHYDKDKVLGLEYYFDYGTAEKAKLKAETMDDRFLYVDEVVQEGQYVKIIFDDFIYNDFTLEQVTEGFKDYTEIIKEEK